METSTGDRAVRTRNKELCDFGNVLCSDCQRTHKPLADSSDLTPATPPAAPTNLAATTVSSSQINLTWADNSSNETGFSIESCKGATCTNFAQIATVGADATIYPNTNLKANTTYRYRVRAYNAAGNSGYSNIATATTLKR